MVRLVIPDDFPNQQTLLQNIIVQNNKLGKDSSLTGFLTQQIISLISL